MPIEHSDIPIAEVHIPYTYSYASSVARTGASGFAAGDVGKFARQTDDNSIWMLIATTPTWVAVSQSAAGLDALSDVIITSAANGHVLEHNGTNWVNVFQKETFTVAVTDETTTITTGTAKITFRMPFAMTLTSVRASVNTVSSSGSVAVDVNEGGASIFSTTLTIDQSEKTSVTAATPAVISDPNLADDAEITVDIDSAGTGAKGLKLVFIGRRAA